MKPTIRNTLIAMLAAHLLTAASVLGQSGGPYVLDWSTIDGGGGQSSGGLHVLTGTIGQPDAAYSQGGQYEVLGGFWPGGPVCLVNFRHFARFAEYWLETGTGLPADLYEDQYNIVDWLDLGVFVDEWLYYCPYDWPLR
ncbi:MAG: hypothetical protein ACYST6_11120 [Planctomycetota bacterium]|jgi:hypothetical protein